jgi:hypothetical protein
MTRFPTGRLAVLVLLAMFACMLSGCWNPFAPPEGDQHDLPPAEYRERTNPGNVIHNLQTAYVWKNAVEYLDCLSEDYVFYPDERDVQDPELEIPEEWYKSNETEMHENMFADGSDVESISLVLTEVAHDSIMGNPADPRDDVHVFMQSVVLKVNLYGGLTYLATAPSQFWVRVDQDQPDDGSDTIWWEIYLWYDNPVRSRIVTSGDENVENISLSRLKSLYMD